MSELTPSGCPSGRRFAAGKLDDVAHGCTAFGVVRMPSNLTGSLPLPNTPWSSAAHPVAINRACAASIIRTTCFRNPAVSRNEASSCRPAHDRRWRGTRSSVSATCTWPHQQILQRCPGHASRRQGDSWPSRFFAPPEISCWRTPRGRSPKGRSLARCRLLNPMLDSILSGLGWY